MGPQTYLWLKAIHIVGFITWLGAMIGAIHILKAHVDEGGGKAFVGLEKQAGIAMDVGATITVIAGLVILFMAPGAPGMYMTGHGYFHAKLAAVVVLLVMHVLTRIKIKRVRNGDTTSMPMWIFALTELSLIATVVLVVVKPF